MSRFPFFREVAGMRVLVVGGGSVALRRASAMAQSGADVTCVAKEFCDGFAAHRCIERGFLDSDLDGMSVVIAATDDHGLNERIAVLCREKGIEVNAADNPEKSTFTFPALIRRGGMTVAVSSDGASPAASRYIRERIEEAIPGHFDEVLSRMESIRRRVKEMEADPQRRSAALRSIFDALVNGEDPADEDELIHRFLLTQMD